MVVDNKIDFVITWVDESDPKWRKDFKDYSAIESRTVDKSPARFRDWGTLQYWFRGVEKFAPWVNKIFFVTYGHLPKWLNTDNPKLVIVKHEDFIPQEYLPTFNSNVIEFFFHKIEGLSERFVYFNDDMFLLNNVSPERFFKDGLPCDKAVIASLERHNGMFGCSVFLANYIVNLHIKKREAIRNNFFKWHSPIYIRTALHNLLFYRYSRFPGFYSHHLPQGYLKQTYNNVWNECENDIKRNFINKFRSYGDVAPWLLRFWQLASGNFVPYDVNKDGKCYYLNDRNVLTCIDSIRNQTYKLICINDNEGVNKMEEYQKLIIDAFDVILPEKCSFEIIDR